MKSNNILKRLSAFLLSAVIIFTVFSGNIYAEPVTEEDTTLKSDEEYLTDGGYQLLCESDGLELYGSAQGDFAGNFAIKNKLDEKLWYSNPSDSSNDTIALNLMKLQSVLAIEYYDQSTNALVELNSKADSVNMGGFSIKVKDNSAVFRFEFPDIKLVIPFEITLGENSSFTVKVNMEKVEENGEYKLFTVTMLPYFLAGNMQEDGFILVPDGSGAIMNFNNKKITYSAYSAAVYGGDYGEIQDEKKVVAERAVMPIFAVSKAEGGIFTVISQGAAQSIVSATVAGIDSCYNTVWNSFEVRGVTTYSLDQGWQGKKVFNVFQKTNPTVKVLENTYYILTSENNSLGGMAETYRGYLAQNGLTEENTAEPKVYIDYLGAVMRQKSVLGFPASVKTVVTDFTQAQKITETLLNSGADDLVIRYLNWNTQSITGKIVNKVSPEGKLGGKGDFKKFSDYLKEKNIEFYPDESLSEYSKNSYPLQQFFTATRNLNKEINKYYPYKLNLYTKDKERDPYYLLSLTKLPDTAQSFLKSYKKLDLQGIGLSGITSYVTADYNSKSKYFGADDGQKIYADIIKIAAESNKLLLDDANMFAAVYANHILNTEGSSGYDMLDIEVPFYQMVLAGSVSYASRPINLSADYRMEFLKAIGSGSGLHYALSYNSDTKNLIDTEYEDWIGTDYKSWAPIIAEQYSEMKKVYDLLESSRPVSYKTDASGICITGFEDGGMLLINYEDTAIDYNGITVAAKGYAVLKGGELVGKSE